MSIVGRPRNNRLKFHVGRFGLQIRREVFPALSIVIDFLIEVEKSPSLAVFESTSYKHQLGNIYT